MRSKSPFTVTQASNDHKDLRRIMRTVHQTVRQWEKLLPQMTEIAYLVLRIFAAKANSKLSGQKTVLALFSR